MSAVLSKISVNAARHSFATLTCQRDTGASIEIELTVHNKVGKGEALINGLGKAYASSNRDCFFFLFTSWFVYTSRV